MGRFPKPCVVCGRRTDGGARCAQHDGRRHALPRPCVECGSPTRAGNYCADHEHLAEDGHNPAYDDPTYRRNRSRAHRRAGGRCELCGLPARYDDPLVCDHIVELARGGTHDLDNLRIVHESYNLARNGRGRAKCRQPG